MRTKYTVLSLMLLVAVASFSLGLIFRPIPQEEVRSAIPYAERLMDLSFSEAERDSMAEGVANLLADYQTLHQQQIDNSTPPALWFDPRPKQFDMPLSAGPDDFGLPADVVLPEDRAELAFYPVAKLSALVRAQKITSLELTELYLDRLKKYGDTLACVITITEDLAIEQAKRADAEIAAGNYRGPLHGIPYGAKDLLSVPEYKTTWGATPYKDQFRPETATVVAKLEEAGAVLVAKLTLGALAWGDVWYGGTTKNPWDLAQGSSGSSAGSASAAVAGLVGFAIGTETLGSIVSPSTRCGASGLRPTFGTVSRHGAMALSWSMDKIGPICRTATDCALVYAAIKGTDGIDQTVVDAPFNYRASEPISALKIGYLKDIFDANTWNKAANDRVLADLQEMGVKLEPVSLPAEIPVQALSFILSAEAAAAFDQLTRSKQDSTLVRQVKNAWPNVFRQARFIPAVEYINANRLRYEMIQQLNDVMEPFDVIVAPTFGGPQLLMTNLSGHPCVVVPNGFNEEGSPTSISFLGNLYEDAKPLLLARAYQAHTDHEDRHPTTFQ